MRLRLAAASGGLFIIGVALLAYSLRSHPEIAGTTGAAPLIPSVKLVGERERCQRVSRVPGGANRLRLMSASATPGESVVRVRITDGDAVVSAGSETAAASGPIVVPLRPPTRTTRAGTLCLSTSGTDKIVLLGELKRLPGAGKGQVGRRAVANAAFLRPGSSTWASRRTTIADRYGNSRAGAFGGWTLYAAIVLAAVAAGLALLTVIRPGE